MVSARVGLQRRRWQPHGGEYGESAGRVDRGRRRRLPALGINGDDGHVHGGRRHAHAGLLMLDLVLFVVIAWLIVYLVIGTIAAILVAREWRRIGCRRRQWRDRNGRREGGGRSHATTHRHVV